MADLGAMVGGAIAILLLSLLWEALVFKRIVDDPLKGKLLSVGVAWLTAGAIGGWGFANGGPYRWDAFIMYFFPALIVGAFAIRAGLKMRETIGWGEDA